MNKILFVGNGFDIAHGLKTRYENFLYLIKKWDELYAEYEAEERNRKTLKSSNQLLLFDDF